MSTQTKTPAQQAQPTPKTKRRRRPWHSFLATFLITVLVLNFAHNPDEFFRYIRHIPQKIANSPFFFDWSWDNVRVFFVNLFELSGIFIVAAILFIVPLVWYLNYEHRSQLRELHKPLPHYKEWDDPDDDQTGHPPKHQ
ncbi:hypothetical protein EFT87_08640 [Schleiferilactobacillus harbinensis]|uniref:hypothetical protein n=1 Tax=Schleiferilactobacillus harbinensis TaxID=304207 RepID=UPI0021A5280D|nr:hypothetical protein [Schleiferilactobacillus harbinensis]MCT2908719.1 hypothetical protein [Schleiferilactobacillus harbinensis]